MQNQAFYRVVVTDCDLGPVDIEREELHGIASVDVARCQTEEQVIEAAREADAIMVQYAPISRPVIGTLEKCKVISRYGVGVDMIDLEAASERGIYVVNVPDYCSEEVSDHTCALILTLARKIDLLYRSVRTGGWDVRIGRPIYPLAGRVLGLLGFGKIARRVAQKMRGFGVHLIAHDPYVSAQVFRREEVQPVGFQELLAHSDILSLHLPLIQETEHILGIGELRTLKPQALIVNTSRGRLIDETALYQVLKDGRVAGVGLDVLESEPIGPGHPLLELENVIITPHAAFYSERSIEQLKRQTARGVACILKDEASTAGDSFTVVNLQMLEHKQTIQKGKY